MGTYTYMKGGFDGENLDEVLSRQARIKKALILRRYKHKIQRRKKMMIKRRYARNNYCYKRTSDFEKYHNNCGSGKRCCKS